MIVRIGHCAFADTTLNQCFLPHGVELIAGSSFPDEFLMNHIDDETFISLGVSSLGFDWIESSRLLRVIGIHERISRSVTIDTLCIECFYNHYLSFEIKFKAVSR
jgi:hypothetical protein